MLQLFTFPLQPPIDSLKFYDPCFLVSLNTLLRSKFFIRKIQQETRSFAIFQRRADRKIARIHRVSCRKPTRSKKRNRHEVLSDKLAQRRFPRSSNRSTDRCTKKREREKRRKQNFSLVESFRASGTLHARNQGERVTRNARGVAFACTA